MRCAYTTQCNSRSAHFYDVSHCTLLNVREIIAAREWNNTSSPAPPRFIYIEGCLYKLLLCVDFICPSLHLISVYARRLRSRSTIIHKVKLSCLCAYMAGASVPWVQENGRKQSGVLSCWFTSSKFLRKYCSLPFDSHPGGNCSSSMVIKKSERRRTLQLIRRLICLNFFKV